MDNLSAPVVENGQAQTETVAGTQSAPAVQTQPSWKSTLRTDLKDSPLLQKFEDTPEGFNKAFESHANLEKLLGHEKVPVPKGPEDTEGWSRYRKAFGIPEKPEGYKLADAQLPDTMKGLTIDKNKFAEVAHSLDLTPAQAAKQWQIYNEINAQTFEKYQKDQETKMGDIVAKLKQEWGDAYNTNVELGQSVINKFADSQEMNDYLTSALSQDPRGIKFLAKVGEQFSENKVGDFQVKRFSSTPEQAKNEIEKIRLDPSHPYTNPKASQADHDAAVQYVNGLYAVVARAKG